jgi:hypothetical protein
LHPAGEEHPLSLRLNFALIFGYCDFEQARFSGDARFERAAFSGGAGFEGAAFSGDAWFQRAAFSGAAGFGRAAFSGTAWFEGAAFSGDAWFGRAAFSGAAWFERAAFSGAARFEGAAFSGAAGFGGAAFSGDARFERAAFSGGALFQTNVFSSHAYFDGAKFNGNMDFTSANFEKLASFERIEWPSAAQHWHSAFDQVLFRGTLSLTGAGLQSFAAFDGARLEGGLQIDEADEQAGKARFKTERRAAIAAAHADGEAFAARERAAREAKDKEKAAPVSRAAIATHVKAQRDARLRELERGCRVLKLAFERAANKNREQMLYRFELQARRAQKKLPLGEALFSDLYALASDYGASMVRPFSLRSACSSSSSAHSSSAGPMHAVLSRPTLSRTRPRSTAPSRRPSISPGPMCSSPSRRSLRRRPKTTRSPTKCSATRRHGSLSLCAPWPRCNRCWRSCWRSSSRSPCAAVSRSADRQPSATKRLLIHEAECLDCACNQSAERFALGLAMRTKSPCPSLPNAAIRPAVRSASARTGSCCRCA